MDFDYPSEKRYNLNEQLNRMDHRYGSIIFSNPIIKIPRQLLHSSVKNKLIKYLQRDQPQHLLYVIVHEKIYIQTDISKDGVNGWNVLHYAAKYNAAGCMESLLKHTFQQSTKKYGQIINTANNQGDTPIIIACQNKSVGVIKCLLDYGGCDIFTSDNRKQTPYHIALSHNDQEILQMLMKYELKIKKKTAIDYQQLRKPVKIHKENLCPCITNCLSSLTSLFISRYPPPSAKPTENETDRKVDLEQISIAENVVWLQPEVMAMKGLPLFVSLSNPFTLRQSNIIVSNLFILFQSLAHHPEFLRTIIFETNRKYYVSLSKKGQRKMTYIENLFPFYEETQEPLLLSLSDQLWPMVLQKALIQEYNGYFEPGKVAIPEIIQTVTGNPAYEIIMPSPSQNSLQSNEQIRKLILDLEKEGCMHMLTPRQSCPIVSEEGRVESFFVLKVTDTQFLINCPFICEFGKQKQAKESRQMRMQKIHYKNPNTMAIWLQENQFHQYFHSIVFCHMSTCKSLIKRQIPLESKRFYLCIKNVSTSSQVLLDFKDDRSDLSMSPVRCWGWFVKRNGQNNDYEYVEKIEIKTLGTVMFELQEVDNNVLLECEFDESQRKAGMNLMLYARSSSKIEVQVMEMFIGDLENLECHKNYINRTYSENSEPLIQKVGSYTMLMMVGAQKWSIPLPKRLTEDDILEGCLVENGFKLEMLQFGNINYAILDETAQLSEQELNSLDWFRNRTQEQTTQ